MFFSDGHLSHEKQTSVAQIYKNVVAGCLRDCWNFWRAPVAQNFKSNVNGSLGNERPSPKILEATLLGV